MFNDKVFTIVENEKSMNFVLLNTVKVKDQNLGLFVEQSLIERFMKGDNVFLDYRVYEINNISVDESGEYDVELVFVQEVEPKVYELIYEAKQVADKKLKELIVA